MGSVSPAKAPDFDDDEEPEGHLPLDWALLEQDVPPVIACAHCGDPNCDGCTPNENSKPPSPTVAVAPLPWEQEGAALWGRLFATAKASAEPQGAFFAGLSQGPVTAAIWFAVLCETCAIFSFSLIWGSVCLALFPRFTWAVLRSPPLLVFAGIVFLALVFFVVFVHALAGLALEWQIGRQKLGADYNRGLRMGLYSCGWDLLTSPVGVGLAVVDNQGPLSLVVAGARIPRAATRAYLSQTRKLDEGQQRSAIRTAMVAMILCVLCLAALVFAGLMWWLVSPLLL